MSCEIKKDPFPENVWFNFHSYCAGCKEFEPDVGKVWVDSFDRGSCKVYTIYCKHAGACARAYKGGDLLRECFDGRSGKR